MSNNHCLVCGDEIVNSESLSLIGAGVCTRCQDRPPERGVLGKVLDGEQQPCPLVLYMTEVEEKDNSKMLDHRKLWQFDLTDGERYFEDAFYYNSFDIPIETVHNRIIKIAIFEYCFTHMKFSVIETPGASPVLRTRPSLRMSSICLLKVCDDSIFLANPDLEICLDPFDWWMNKPTEATFSTIDVSDTAPVVSYPIAPDASAMVVDEGFELNGYCHVFPLYRTKRDTCDNEKSTQAQSHHFVVPTSTSATSSTKGFFRQFMKNLGSNSSTLQFRLIDEPNSLLVLVDATVCELFPYEALIPNTVPSHCVQICVATLKFNTNVPSNQLSTPTLCGTYNCPIDNNPPKPLITIMMNARTGDLICVFNEGRYGKHGLYSISLPSKAKTLSSSRDKGKMLQLKPIVAKCVVNWPSPATHYKANDNDNHIPGAHTNFVWRNNGEQLISVLHAPDRFYIAIFTMSYTVNNNKTVMEIVDIRFISLFEHVFRRTPDDDPTIVDSCWPPLLFGCYGRFIVFAAKPPDIYLVDLLHRSRSSVTELQRGHIMLVTNLETKLKALLEKFRQNGEKYFKFEDEECRRVKRQLEVYKHWMHPGAVLLVEAGISFHGGYKMDLLLKCELSQILDSCKQLIEQSAASNK